MQSENINELATALAKAQGEMTHAKKAEDNPFFKSKYADLSACIDAARPHLAKNGLSVIHLTQTDEAGGISLVTYLLHSSGQWISGVYPIKPTKNDPQGIGSAMTYARRYAYAAITGIAASGEDDDGNAASDNTANTIESVKAAEIDHLLNETKSDKAKFFAAFAVSSALEIKEKDYPRAIALLKRKQEQVGRASA